MNKENILMMFALLSLPVLAVDNSPQDASPDIQLKAQVNVDDNSTIEQECLNQSQKLDSAIPEILEFDNYFSNDAHIYTKVVNDMYSFYKESQELCSKSQNSTIKKLKSLAARIEKRIRDDVEAELKNLQTPLKNLQTPIEEDGPRNQVDLREFRVLLGIFSEAESADEGHRLDIMKKLDAFRTSLIESYPNPMELKSFIFATERLGSYISIFQDIMKRPKIYLN